MEKHITQITDGVLSIGYGETVGSAGTIPSGPGNLYDGSAFSSVIIEPYGTWDGALTIESGATVTLGSEGVYLVVSF